ncbi:putative tail component, partial [Escherichia coli 0.1304]
YSGAVKL